MDLKRSNQHCRLLADSTRVRLLSLLDQEEFSVAELAAITQLAQPRVSTHLAKLREASLVSDRRDGVSVYYRLARRPADSSLLALWRSIRSNTDDPLLDQDSQRVAQVLAARANRASWADSVAGDMERHYSPGRTWEATTRALVHLLKLGDVLDLASGDGVLAELIAPHANSVLCIDLSERVVKAGRKRLKSVSNVRFEQGDMHQLELPDEQFDTVLMMHALTFSHRPKMLFRESARVLRRGGQLLAVTLQRHGHENTVTPYDHVNLGFTTAQLNRLCRDSGLVSRYCMNSSTEKRPPNFSVITLLADKP